MHQNLSTKNTTLNQLAALLIHAVAGARAPVECAMRVEEHVVPEFMEETILFRVRRFDLLSLNSSFAPQPTRVKNEQVNQSYRIKDNKKQALEDLLRARVRPTREKQSLDVCFFVLLGCSARSSNRRF